MRPFAFVAAGDAASAIRAAGVAPAVPAPQAPAQFLAGGTTLLDLMKLDVMRPATLVDVNALRPPPGAGVATQAGGLRLDAFASMADVAADPRIVRGYPVIAQSLLLAASPQIRQMATLGGNLLQRTRCPYFRHVGEAACNKRDPGSGCAARGGPNRQHAVLGTSAHCIATYPGDFAQALLALDAVVETAGPRSRRIALADLHVPPGDAPQRETTLAPGELIRAIEVPALPWAARSLYLKVRDRASYQFALASAAVALDVQAGVVRDVRIALGGVATVPWRARDAEAALRGRALDEGAARAAAEAAFAAAAPAGQNRFKVALGRQTLVRALLEAGQLSA